MRPEFDDTFAVPAARGAPGPGSAAPALSRTATADGRPAPDEPAAGGSVSAGQQLGHFRIERPLGAGGMGEVYLATDLALDRPVAVKVLPGGLARDPARRDRMVREARAQARVSHPNVGHIYFIGEEAGRLYFAMEYVAGQTIADQIAAGALRVEDALAIVRSAALGLREAHRSGITHRDIKPSNLMIDGHGMLKVLDFGLAAGGPGMLGEGPVAQTSLAGTPLYMAPEQARGEPVDFRADIYALGATLYHLVSGHPPFEADTLDALLSKHASAVRPVLPRKAGMPRTMIAAIDALIARMMAPAPGDRFASYDELIRALELASLDHTRPAGFWVRIMATAVDLLLALVVALPTLALAEVVFSRKFDDEFEFVLLLYALGAAALTARNGRTPGQSLFELSIIDLATGRRPSLRRAALRVALPIAPLLVGSLASFVIHLYARHTPGWFQALAVLSCAALPVLLAWASLRSHSKQAVWDRLSGTRVSYHARRTTAI